MLASMVAIVVNAFATEQTVCPSGSKYPPFQPTKWARNLDDSDVLGKTDKCAE